MGRDMIRDQEYQDYIQNHMARTRGARRQSVIIGDTEIVGLAVNNRNNPDCGGSGGGGRPPDKNPKSRSKNDRIPIPKHVLENDRVFTGLQHPYGCIILPLLLILFVLYILYCFFDFAWVMGVISSWVWSITGVPCKTGGSSLTEEEVNKLICKMITKYDADKTGLPDLALASGGGQIVSTRDTKYSKTKDGGVTFMGVPIYKEPNEVINTIKPEIAPGTCWEFEGSGNIVIKLINPAVISGFSVEHLPKDNSPTGHINSAPKNIAVLGLKDPKNLSTAHSFGEYVYDGNGYALQYFQPLSTSQEAFPFVEFKIMSNHGAEKTCLYRVRVHGRYQRPGEKPICSDNSPAPEPLPPVTPTPAPPKTPTPEPPKTPTPEPPKTPAQAPPVTPTQSPPTTGGCIDLSEIPPNPKLKYSKS